MAYNSDELIPLDPYTMQPYGNAESMRGYSPPKQSFGQKFVAATKNILGDRDLALALLQNSGYSQNKRSFGEILGTSLGQSQQAKSGRADDDLRRQYMQAQIQNMQSPRGDNKLISVIGKDGKPTLMRESEAAGMTPDRKSTRLNSSHRL